MLRRTLLIAITFAVAAPALATVEQPADIVAAIYKVSAGKKGDYSGNSAFNDKSIRARYFSKGLMAAVMKMEKKSQATNEPILDFDPVSDSQDPSVKRLKITLEGTDNTNSVVAASFYSFDNKEPSIVRYFFIAESDGWRLDNMTGGTGDLKWSLRDLIK